MCFRRRSAAELLWWWCNTAYLLTATGCWWRASTSTAFWSSQSWQREITSASTCALAGVRGSKLLRLDLINRVEEFPHTEHGRWFMPHLTSSLSLSLRRPSDIRAAVGDCEVLVREWRVSSLEPHGMSVFASGGLMKASAREAVSVFLRLESWQTTVLCHCSVCFITNQIHKLWTQATFNPDVKSSDAMQIFSFYMIDEYWALLCTCNIHSSLLGFACSSQRIAQSLNFHSAL